MVSLKQFQRLLGHLASAAAVTPLGLLHMRPLQHLLHSRVPRWAWRRGTLRVGISQQCRRSLSPWTDLAFLQAGVPLEQVSRHTVVITDACSTGWGATCNRQAAPGLWTGPRLLWHINCLELWAVHLALRQFQPLLLGKHVLICTGNNAVVSYINRLGGIRSHRMSQLARHLLLWSHTQFKSLRAVHIPRQLNRAADALSRQLTFPGEWRLHPETIRLIWSRFGEAQVDLFGPPRHRRTGTQLASGLTQVCVSPSEPTRTDTVQAQGGRGACPACCAPLAHPDLVSRTHFPRDSTSLAHSSEEGPPFSGARHHMAPASRSMEPPCVAPGRDTADLSGLPPAVVETIIQARAPSTRQTYALKLSLFATWCSSRREDPRRCTIGVVLSFLQKRFERRLSPSTLKVYVAAIAAHHDAVDGRSLGKHDLIVRFLKGARRMNPSRGIPRSGGEPASTALGGGRSSLSVTVSRKSIAHIRDPHPERQKLRAALCLPRRAAEKEGCLQTEVGPLDSGGRRLGVPVTRRAVHPGGEGSLHQECCLLPCIGARCLFGRHLQSCGLGETEHLRKILQSSR